jgi:hypothetical protein
MDYDGRENLLAVEKVDEEDAKEGREGKKKMQGA